MIIQEREKDFWRAVVFLVVISAVISVTAFRALLRIPAGTNHRIWMKSFVTLTYQLPFISLSLLGLAFFGWYWFWIGLLFGLGISFASLALSAASATEQQPFN